MNKKIVFENELFGDLNLDLDELIAQAWREGFRVVGNGIRKITYVPVGIDTPIIGGVAMIYLERGVKNRIIDPAAIFQIPNQEKYRLFLYRIENSP